MDRRRQRDRHRVLWTASRFLIDCVRHDFSYRRHIQRLIVRLTGDALKPVEATGKRMNNSSGLRFQPVDETN